MSTKNGLGGAVREGQAIGCTAIQVFTSSPQQWKSSPVTQDKVDSYKKALEETGIDPMAVVSHDSYLINLSAADEEMREKSVDGLKNEVFRCALYGIPYTVSHVGASKGWPTEEDAIQVAAENLVRVLDDTPDTVTVLMETTAGQGSSLNYKFEQLASTLEFAGSPNRLCVCLDTCHIFVAGYDIRTPEAYEKTFAEFGRLIGFDRLKAIHCNDSKNELGKRVDRHAHIGEGLIGPTAFELLVNDPRFERTPILLETNDGESMHEVNLRRLQSFRR